MKCIQRRATEMTQGMEHLSYEGRLREMGLCSVEKRRLWGDLKAAFQYLKRRDIRKKGTECLAGCGCVLIGQEEMVSN